MKPDEIEDLAIAVAKALQRERSISDAEHSDHHKWISGRIRLDEEQKKFWEDMRTHASKWGMISILSASFYALWLGIRQIFRVIT